VDNELQASTSVRVSTVIYVEDIHSLLVIIDAIAHPILAPVSTPLTLEGLPQQSSYPTGLIGQGTEDELDASSSHRLGQSLRQATRRAPGHDDPVTHSSDLDW
jgi:hypothetical protein